MTAQTDKDLAKKPPAPKVRRANVLMALFIVVGGWVGLNWVMAQPPPPIVSTPTATRATTVNAPQGTRPAIVAPTRTPTPRR